MQTKSIEVIKTVSIIAIVLLFGLQACQSEKIIYSDWELVVDNQSFPEGITWDNNGTLYSSNCYSNWITRITEEKIDTFLLASDSTFGKTNGMIALSDGSLIACDYGNGEILKFNSDGNTEMLINGYENKSFNRPNDLTIDEDGNLYFTDPKSYGKEKLDGRLFYYNFKKQNLSLLKDSLAFPNGIGISNVDSKLYVCESAKSRILRFEISENNELLNQEVFIELPGGDPDGFNFDDNGNMYVAHFGSGTLYIISPKGKILHKIKTPGKKPSNVEFAGNDRKTLYLTEDETNSIYKMELNIPGYSNF